MNITRLLSRYLLILGCTCIGLLFLFVTQIPSYYAGSWGIFHYYLGAKYIKEIGYFDIYSCAIEATENTGVWSTTSLVRELHTYRVIPRDQLPQCPRNKFTNSRWKEFTHDVEVITKEFSHDVEVLTNSSLADYWSQVVTDKGFNPPPSWAAFAGFVANTFSLDNRLLYLLI